MNRRSGLYHILGRNLMVAGGIAVLLWSGMEDSDAVLATALGLVMAAAVTTWLLDSKSWRARFAVASVPKQAALAGVLTGALASVSTPLLMLFKDLRHAHIYPDFPPGMMLATLERMPAWALAGGLAGFGIGILVKLGADRLASR